MLVSFSGLLSQRIYNPQIIEPLRNFTGWEYLQRLYPIFIALGIIITTVVFVLLIIIGGIAWVTAGGDREKLDTARRRVINGVIGIFLVLLVFFVLIWIGRIFKINFLGQFNIGTTEVLPIVTPTGGVTPIPSDEEFLCISNGGTWREFGNACVDLCNPPGNCSDVITWGCDCGDGSCWDPALEACVLNPNIITPTQAPFPTVSLPTNTPTPGIGGPPTSTPTPLPTVTPQPTNTPIPTATPRPTNTPTPRPTNTPIPTSTPTSIPTATPTPRPTNTPTPRPTNTPVPTNTPIPTPTPIPFFCSDTDGGQSYFQQGTVTDNTYLPGGQIESVTDYCTTGNALGEFYCNGTIRSTELYQCGTSAQSTCFNGECCSWVGQACNVDSDCCTNYACQGGSCVSPSILLNEALGLSCYTYCQASGFSTCASVGTDTFASNGMMYVYQNNSCILTNAYDCNRVIYDNLSVCGGREADWTRCRCI
ncbi:hypothetical protein A3A76_05400 [Candidatus Woesebacteria bacterium RIFCSPLOWO2_01_FULL_39_23]|uniref:Uncharacterized protein n=2 Tax=Microgenomates group TaxID=1794810 RepID=A0A0H4T3Z1_9BACT|nr:hypothetical protein [uncultured Microgenomates bacterium Rifle_16ft_4_minimus_37633]OGM13915.1 MAG: hypothetical protein A2141_04625 [Candidatus Woesebacteria bacterium RBG_16_40_11]OGM27867.1 MAG: hypothetical protein A2628_05620 [Candidatus Woesebacteria bacterium RIFCSPHIGHO2_01_FULL_40_22]OGM36328.1 MAG: hypothetical protein A3E41_02820 [Candidatus Woesebacteria bacterium RIFCSPHIGHO2_12_FULL_38_9]OGM62289.1 MAG: hypothetical protein A3A76_05400 [Candidatus Woesebacteria bacterium RIFCS